MFNIKMHKNLDLTVTQLLLLLKNKTAPQVIFKGKKTCMSLIPAQIEVSCLLSIFTFKDYLDLNEQK